MHKTATKQYWRSLDRLLESPALDGILSPEFSEAADTPPGNLDRRTMLRLMGASLALGGLASCRRPEEAIVPFVNAPENLIPGIAKHYATALTLGADAVGVLVETHEGRPVKIEGNELHPSSQGAANCWMQASILQLYDPDRSRGPQRRNPQGLFESSSWDEFARVWEEAAARLESVAGRGLSVLSEAHCSPTMARTRQQFQKRFPDSQWVVWEPLGATNIFDGLRMATGQACRPVHHLDRARKILSLDADFLLTEDQGVAHARGFSRSRQPDGENGRMNRLYVVESSLSVTGSNADHRIRMHSSQALAFALRLAARLKSGGLDLDLPESGLPRALPESTEAWLDRIAEDLLGAQGESVVIAGCRQPPALHALCFALNEALGAAGRTVSYHPADDLAGANGSSLRQLKELMDRGEIDTLVVLGANPAYSAPGQLEVSSALESVGMIVHFGYDFNETAELAHWHLPRSHPFETWGDTRSADGSLSVIQPVIAPLLDSRSPVEFLSILANGEERKGYELVRETWREWIQEDFETAWRRTLHDGILQDSRSQELALKSRPGLLSDILAGNPGRTQEGLELVLAPCPKVFDGRFSNLAWLQELPDAITKIVWDNAALVSSRTAEEFGLQSGDVVSLRVGEREVLAPVWILPGQADNSVTIPLGYGRSVGRVAKGVGFNAYRLQGADSSYFEYGLEIRKTGDARPLAQTQEHWEMAGRSMVREATLSEYRADPGFAREKEQTPRSLWQEHDYSEGYQWGMVIDLNSCLGCNACVVACQSENNIPVVGKDQVARGREMQWLRIDRYFSGELADPGVVHQPVPCMHCENAPCEEVCPVAATVHDREGLNSMVYNRCIGTRYCSNNCPYKVRRFNFFNYTKDLPELLQLAMNPDVTVRSRGVMEKCTYCIQRINESKIAARAEERPVRDGDIRTACQQTCPTDAIVFGNINDPDSRVSQLKSQDRNYVVLAELNNRPRTSYLAKLRNPESEGVENS